MESSNHPPTPNDDWGEDEELVLVRRVRSSDLHKIPDSNKHTLTSAYFSAGSAPLEGASVNSKKLLEQNGLDDTFETEPEDGIIYITVGDVKTVTRPDRPDERLWVGSDPLHQGSNRKPEPGTADNPAHGQIWPPYPDGSAEEYLKAEGKQYKKISTGQQRQLVKLVKWIKIPSGIQLE